MQIARPERGSAVHPGTLERALRSIALIWEQPLWSALLSMLAYALIGMAHYNLLQPSEYAYFNYLAHAFLNGQLHLIDHPERTHDLSLYLGQYYLYWPPFPAVLLIPFVAIWGVGFSDLVFTIALGGLNVALIAVLLRAADRRGIARLNAEQRGLLVLTLALGTVHVTLAPYGRVWGTGQLVGFGCLIVAYVAAIDWRGWRAFLAAGIAVGCAMLTRNHLALTGLWPALWLLVRSWQQRDDRRWPRLIGNALAGLLPVIVALAIYGGYNWLRFGSVGDNGVDYHRMSPLFRADYDRYGLFNAHYIPTNLRYQYLVWPFPLREGKDMGGSLFLLTPLFVAAFVALVRGRPRWSIWMMALTIALTAIPILLLMGTGWRQFGPRYTLDFTVPLLLLTAIGMRDWPIWIVRLCVLLSVAQYIVGAIWLGGVI